MSVTVSTKEELEAAIKRNEQEIIVIGELAEKIQKTQTLKRVFTGVRGAGLIALLGLATVSAPLTGGLSYFAAAPVAAVTGVPIAVIIVAISIGIIILYAIYREYDVECEAAIETDPTGKERKKVKVTLRKK